MGQIPDENHELFSLRLLYLMALGKKEERQPEENGLGSADGSHLGKKGIHVPAEFR